MKRLVQPWQRQARRVDALSLRERVFMFASVAVALVAAADTLVVSPRMAEQKAMTLQIRQSSTELLLLQSRLVGDAGDTPSARLSRELGQLASQQRSLDEEIARRTATGDGATRLSDLLERVLRRHDRLTLLRLATSAPVAMPPARLPRQAVEVVVRGSYVDLLAYVAETEAALPGLRWGALTVASHGGATELAAQVFLLGALR